MEFKDRLKQKRIDKGLTQAELGKAINLTQAAIQSLENGRVKSTTHILTLAKALDTTPEYLLYGTEKAKLQAENNLRAFSLPPLISLPLLENGAIIAAWVKHGVLPDNYRSISMPLPQNLTASKKTYIVDITDDPTSTLMFPKVPNMRWLAVVDPQSAPEIDHFVIAATKDGMFKFRRYTKDLSGFILTSPDPKEPHLRLEDVELMGAVKIFSSWPIDNQPPEMIMGGGVNSPRLVEK